MVKSHGLTREDLLNLEKGEVVEYDRGRGKEYLIVDKVRQNERVTGEITEALGVNSIPIEELVSYGIRLAKWRTN